jgi:hypothetical protein
MLLLLLLLLAVHLEERRMWFFSVNGAALRASKFRVGKTISDECSGREEGLKASTSFFNWVS